jgi:spermidine/putrescine-binding protein
MLKKIVGFGDSFVFGSEQQNNIDGSLGWPGRAAQALNVDYTTTAVAGCGNDHIARQIYSYFANNPVEDTLAVINWTWMSRWDFYIVEHETWITLGPTCVPAKLKNLVDQTEAHDMIDFYQTRANSSLIWNKVRNLQTIYAAQAYLKQRRIKNIQTYMDYQLFDQTYHAPDYIKELQRLVFPDLQLFEGLNFVDWSRKKGFVVTDIGMHPLEDAQQAAAQLWRTQYVKQLEL